MKKKIAILLVIMMSLSSAAYVYAEDADTVESSATETEPDKGAESDAGLEERVVTDTGAEANVVVEAAPEENAVTDAGIEENAAADEEVEIVDAEYNASAPNGIMNNGIYGINININAAPYTTFANGPYGQYAYGKEGCAWFASARVKQLTGKGSTIYSGASWYNTQYEVYGFKRGSKLKAKALACYGNHVTVVEEVNGDTVTVSEGGISNGSDAAHGYCIIQKISKSKLESARNGCGDFIGYVYIGDTSTIGAPEDTVVNAMHRLYNPNSGEHFYTASVGEKKNLVSVGWKYEGIAWKAPTTGKPVHRLYNPNAGDHHYTTSAAEKNHLINCGWKYEGVGWYSGGSVPLYRAYNPNALAGAHHYSTNKDEVNNLVSVGWKYEGTAWYGY